MTRLRPALLPLLLAALAGCAAHTPPPASGPVSAAHAGPTAMLPAPH